MNDWREVKLGEICDIIKDTYKPDIKDNLSYLGLEHIEQGSLRLNGIGNSKDIKSNKFKFQSNDVLLGKLRVYFRKVFKPNFSGICSTDIWVLRAKELLNQNFLFYFIANWDFINIADGGEGGTRMPRADWKFLKMTEWIIPPLPEQKVIASVLSSLDDKIDLLHCQNETLEKMAETLFRQWFVEEAKDDWEVKPLSSIANFLNGLACQKFPPKNNIEKLPVLKIKELSSGITDNSDFASTDIKEEYIVKNGDVIFAWSASLMVKIWNGEDCILNQHLFKVTSNTYPKWFYYFWCKQHLREFISKAASHATTMGHIKRTDLDNAMVLSPSNEDLKIMSKQMEPLLVRTIENQKQIQILTNLRDTLLPKLMCGEVRVAV